MVFAPGDLIFLKSISVSEITPVGRIVRSTPESGIAHELPSGTICVFLKFAFAGERQVCVILSPFGQGWVYDYECIPIIANAQSEET